MTLSEHIKQKRKKNGLSQVELAVCWPCLANVWDLLKLKSYETGRYIC